MVGNHRLVLGSNHTQQGANQCPTLLAKHRHLSVVGLLSRDIDLISAALFKLIVIIDTKFSPKLYKYTHNFYKSQALFFTLLDLFLILNIDATIPDNTTPVVPNKDIIALFIPSTADESTSPKQTAHA
jgi:hypothetical protein